MAYGQGTGKIDCYVWTTPEEQRDGHNGPIAERRGDVRETRRFIEKGRKNLRLR